MLDKADGALKGRHSLGAATMVGEPIVDADRVYFIDSDGDLRSISVTRGR